MHHSSGGAVRIIGRVSLLSLVNQGGYQFLQKIGSIWESRLLRTQLCASGTRPNLGAESFEVVMGAVVRHSLLPDACRTWTWGHNRAQDPGEGTPVSLLPGRTGLGFYTCVQVGQEKSAWFMVLLFVRAVKWQLQSLPCLISNSSQTLSAWVDEEMIWLSVLSTVCSFLHCTHLLLESVNPFRFCQVASYMETFFSVQSLCLISGSSTQKEFLQAQCLTLVLLKYSFIFKTMGPKERGLY